MQCTKRQVWERTGTGEVIFFVFILILIVYFSFHIQIPVCS